MDWYLHPTVPETVTALRSEIGAYLRRHAVNQESVPAAELATAELIANAVEHAADPAWVSLDWSGIRPVLTVHDLGPQFALDLSLPDVVAERGRGLWLVSQLGTDLTIAAKRTGGKRISVTLPVERVDKPPEFQKPVYHNPLPDRTEAGPDGYGREAFLRALAVQFSLEVESEHGPLLAQAAIARVGAMVGGQMEDEYRRARGIAGRLTPEQLADCFIRLKAAIDGDFYPIEIEPERVVLGNRRCPFGNTAVRYSPSLCRMTSSVFGGIAARNTGEAVVVLEERIAVGDPECRVVVLLGQAAEDATNGQRYRIDPLVT